MSAVRDISIKFNLNTEPIVVRDYYGRPVLSNWTIIRERILKEQEAGYPVPELPKSESDSLKPIYDNFLNPEGLPYLSLIAYKRIKIEEGEEESNKRPRYNFCDLDSSNVVNTKRARKSGSRLAGFK